MWPSGRGPRRVKAIKATSGGTSVPCTGVHLAIRWRSTCGSTEGERASPHYSEGACSTEAVSIPHASSAGGDGTAGVVTIGVERRCRRAPQGCSKVSMRQDPGRGDDPGVGDPDSYMPLRQVHMGDAGAGGIASSVRRDEHEKDQKRLTRKNPPQSQQLPNAPLLRSEGGHRGHRRPLVTSDGGYSAVGYRVFYDEYCLSFLKGYSTKAAAWRVGPNKSEPSCWYPIALRLSWRCGAAIHVLCLIAARA